MRQIRIYEDDNEFQSKKPLRAKVLASDDWYPSLPGGLVDMTFYPDDKHITIWGDDDFGMEKIHCKRSEFEKLSTTIINQKMLYKMGFKDCG